MKNESNYKEKSSNEFIESLDDNIKEKEQYKLQLISDFLHKKEMEYINRQLEEDIVK